MRYALPSIREGLAQIFLDDVYARLGTAGRLTEPSTLFPPLTEEELGLAAPSGTTVTFSPIGEYLVDEDLPPLLWTATGLASAQTASPSVDLGLVPYGADITLDDSLFMLDFSGAAGGLDLPYYGGSPAESAPLGFDTWSPVESWDFGAAEMYSFDDSTSFDTGDIYASVDW
jgi:hypothetical protein